MDTTQSPDSTTRALIASAQELDPNSPEFYDACQALIKQSAGRRLAARTNGVDSAEIPPVLELPAEAEIPQQPPRAARFDAAAESAALREARRREGQVRAELETLQAELTHVKTRYNETLSALEAASERASQARIEFGNAMTAISEREAAINEMRQVIADQDREINELQQLLIHAEEARIADASAILDSLDKYRA